MAADHLRTRARSGWAGKLLMAGVLALASSPSAMASIGTAYVRINGIEGSAREADRKGWVVSAAHYWKSDELGIFGGRQLESSKRNAFQRPRMVYSGPTAPVSGASQLVLTVAKSNPALTRMMQACHERRALGQVGFAESSVLARGLRELGPRPEAIPEWFEYQLDDARIVSCPVVDGAPEQAFVIAFGGIRWLNYAGTAMGVDNPLKPAMLPPIPAKGKVRTFVLSWFAVANDVTDDQCPKLNAKPPQDAFYTYLSPEQAAAEREKHKANGVIYENGEMELRGPERMNVALLPGIVPDTGHYTAVSRTARGLDLDKGKRTAKPDDAALSRIPGYNGYVDGNGRKGIDNRLFLVEGCMQGLQGHKGFLMQYTNEQRRNGLLSMLVQVAGIDNDRKDDHVLVTILYSKDPMAKSADGHGVLPDFTFRQSRNPEFSHYAITLQGRIANGVIETERVPVLQIQGGLDPELTLHDAGMRLEFTPEGNLKGVIGGYQDWRRIMMVTGTSNSEFHYGFQAPGFYGALKRFADAMPDPETGEFTGISSAYDIEGVPAFLPPEELQAMREVKQAPAPTGQGKARR